MGDISRQQQSPAQIASLAEVDDQPKFSPAFEAARKSLSAAESGASQFAKVEKKEQQKVLGQPAVQVMLFLPGRHLCMSGGKCPPKANVIESVLIFSFDRGGGGPRVCNLQQQSRPPMEGQPAYQQSLRKRAKSSYHPAGASRISQEWLQGQQFLDESKVETGGGNNGLILAGLAVLAVAGVAVSSKGITGDGNATGSDTTPRTDEQQEIDGRNAKSWNFNSRSGESKHILWSHRFCAGIKL
jgi:hypothetical protein